MEKWESVVFSDEKMLLAWFKKEEAAVSKGPFGGGYVMVLGAFSMSGKADLEMMEEK